MRHAVNGLIQGPPLDYVNVLTMVMILIVMIISII